MKSLSEIATIGEGVSPTAINRENQARTITVTATPDPGYVVENINNPQSVQVFDCNDNLVARYAVPEQVNGYEYEFSEAVRCIREGKLEPDSMPHADTIQVMEMMDSLRKEWGIVYPQEQ